MYELRKIQSCFNFMSTSARENARASIELLEDYSSEDKRNKWFMRSAKLLSLHSKINVQKSYWRMRENVKKSSHRRKEERAHSVKKVAAIIGKYEKYNLLRAFYSIMRVGKRGAERMDVSTIVKEKYESQPGMPGIMVSPEKSREPPMELPREPPRQSLGLHLDQFHRDVESSIEVPTSSGQLTGVRIAERVFRRSLARQVTNWQNNAAPEGKLERVRNEAEGYSATLVTDISRYGAAESMARIAELARMRSLGAAFRVLGREGGSAALLSDDLEEKLELINRQTTLMEEIRGFREENEVLNEQVVSRDRELQNANETISLLSLRINYIILQKFLGMTTKVMEEVEYRHYNDAFDALIEAANANYEQQQEGVLSELDF